VALRNEHRAQVEVARLRPRERIGREHSAVLAPVAMPRLAFQIHHARCALYQPVRAKYTARRA
jgi:hypothetical protein